jgi:hypothetical protein
MKKALKSPLVVRRFQGFSLRQMLNLGCDSTQMNVVAADAGGAMTSMRGI